MKKHTTNSSPSEFLLLALALFCSGSVWFAHSALQLPMHAVLLAWALFVYVRSPNSRRSHVRLLAMLALGGFAAMLCIQYVLSPPSPSPTQYLYIYAKLVSATCICLVYCGKQTQFARDLTTVLRLILLHALVGYALFPFVRASLVPFTNKIHTFLYLFYYNSPNSVYGRFFLGGVALQRNSGLFWEPGVLQFYLNTLLLLELFTGHGRYWIAALCCIAVMTTWSTTGVILMSCILIAWGVSSWKRIHPLARAGTIACLFPVLAIAHGNFVEKTQGVRSNSYEIRISDSLGALGLIRKYPLTGVGPDFILLTALLDRHAVDVGAVNRENQVQTARASNSVLTLVASLGCIAGPIFFLLMYRQKLLPLPAPICFGALVLTLVSEPLVFTVFILLFPISGLVSMIENHWRKRYAIDKAAMRLHQK